MNEEVKSIVIEETENEMMNSMRQAETRIIIKCAETLDCEHSRDTIARRLMHDSCLWNEVWESAKSKLEFWKNYLESQRGTNYAGHLKSILSEE